MSNLPDNLIYKARINHTTIELSGWKNKTKEDKEFETLKIRRSWKDEKAESGYAEESISLPVRDVPGVAAAMVEAYKKLGVSIEKVNQELKNPNNDK